MGPLMGCDSHRQGFDGLLVPQPGGGTDNQPVRTVYHGHCFGETGGDAVMPWHGRSGGKAPLGPQKSKARGEGALGWGGRTQGKPPGPVERRDSSLPHPLSPRRRRQQPD